MNYALKILSREFSVTMQTNGVNVSYGNLNIFSQYTVELKPKLFFLKQVFCFVQAAEHFTKEVIGRHN